jgi:hypothetical protein
LFPFTLEQTLIHNINTIILNLIYLNLNVKTSSSYSQVKTRSYKKNTCVAVLHFTVTVEISYRFNPATFVLPAPSQDLDLQRHDVMSMIVLI